MNQYTDAGLARMMGLPVPTQTHLAVCELLGVHPMEVRARHRPDLTIQAPTRTEESPHQPDTIPSRVSSRADGGPTTPTPGFSAPR